MVCWLGLVQAMDNPSKSIIFNVFQGEDFGAWAEDIMLMLMDMGLWEVVSGEDISLEKDEDSEKRSKKVQWKR